MTAAPIQPAPLATGDVHVWRIGIGPDLSASDYVGVLSSNEREQAARRRLDADRNAFVIAHGAMRLILSSYVTIAPAELRFRIGQFGKPSLDRNESRLEFNLAHSGELALLAVARDHAVGIDVARKDPSADLAGIVQRFFSPNEARAAESVDAFYSVWTRKEAYVKATGRGLSRELDHFDVSVAPDPAMLIGDRLDPDAPSRWAMLDLDIADGYSAALVVAKPVGKVVLLDGP